MGSDTALVVSGSPGDWKIQLPTSAPDKIASVVQVDIAGTPEVEPSTNGVTLETEYFGTSMSRKAASTVQR